jgi:hypothetical protein
MRAQGVDQSGDTRLPFDKRVAAMTGLDQIGRSEVVQVAITVPDWTTRVLAGVHDPSHFAGHEAVDPPFAADPHKLFAVQDGRRWFMRERADVGLMPNQLAVLANSEARPHYGDVEPLSAQPA